MNQAGPEWSRRKPSDIDEARRVSSRERANQSNQCVERKLYWMSAGNSPLNPLSKDYPDKSFRVLLSLKFRTWFIF